VELAGQRHQVAAKARFRGRGLGPGRRIWRPWLWRMLVGRWRAVRPGPIRRPKSPAATPEAVDFLFERVHSVRNNRNSHSLMLGRESAHSERSPPLRETSEPAPPPAFSGGRSTVLRDVSTCRLQANAASTPRSVCSLQARPLTFTCKPHSPSWRAIFKKWRQSANGPSRPIRVERTNLTRSCKVSDRPVL
jgi:hypothetical protein